MKNINTKYSNFIPTLKLMDDEFMTVIFRNKKCCEQLLRIVLNKDDLEVLECHTQYEIKNIYGHSVKFDIRALDSKNTYYDIEVQRNSSGAIPKRARFNSSLLDMNILKKGKDYSELPESYVIFLSEVDIFGKGLQIYHINRYIKELNQPFNDESNIVYVNFGKVKDIQDKTLQDLKDDFYCEDSKKIKNEIFRNEVIKYKEMEEEQMCKEFDLMMNEKYESGIQAGIQTGIELGKESNTISNLKSLMKKMNIGLEEAMDLLEINSNEKSKYLKAFL